MQPIFCESREALGRRAAEHGARVIRRVIADRGRINIIVATGASQFDTLAALVDAPDIRWDRVTAFHLDEYVGVDVTHPASFRRYLWQRFQSRLPLPLAAFYGIDGTRPASEEAHRIGAILRNHAIDLAFVGIGENGHMAFNDPPADFMTDEPYLVVELDERCRRQQLGEGWFSTLDDVPLRAISVSIRQILKSAVIIASVPDARKAKAVRESFVESVDPRYPSTCLKRHAHAFVYLDETSAALLPDEWRGRSASPEPLEASR